MGYFCDFFSDIAIGRSMLIGAVIGGGFGFSKGLPGMIGGAIGGALLFAVAWQTCRFILKSYGCKLQNFPLKDTPSIEDNPTSQDPHRLTLNQAKQSLYKVVSKMDQDLFNYLYLFAFDRDDRLIWGNVIMPDDPPNKLELIISWAGLEAELLNSENNPDNIYFMLKLKTFPDYFEGFSDMQGTMTKAKGFIEAWKDFEEKRGADNPALKRYTVEFVNQKLGLPFRYSEAQRLKDMEEL